MKATLKKVLTVAFSFVFAFVILFAVPTFASAAGDYVTGEEIFDKELEENLVHVKLDDFNASIESINMRDVYSVDISISGANVSSFSFELVMPWFVSIKHVALSDELQNVENSIFDSNIDDNKISVYAAYSSATESTDISIMTVYFTFSTIEEFYEYAYFNNCIFTNLSAEYIQSECQGGCFDIYPDSNDVQALKGDANLDGSITLEDIMFIMRYIVNNDEELSYEQFENADIDRNGNIDIVDCQYIQNYLAGIIGSLDDVNSKEECSHIKYQETDRVEATCNNDGFVEYYCYDCGSYFRETLYATGEHSFDENGACSNCGEQNATVEKVVRYTYKSKNLSLILYSDYSSYFTEHTYTAEGMVFTDEGESNWFMLADEGRIYAKTVNGKEYVFTVTESGDLVPYEEGGDIVEPEICKHENTRTEITDATCTENGCIRIICTNCDEIISVDYTEPIGHKYNADYICEICGESEVSEISISEALTIGHELKLAIIGKETFTVTGTVTEASNDYNVGIFRVQDENGYGIYVFSVIDGTETPRIGETVTISGTICKFLGHNVSIPCLANVTVHESEEGLDVIPIVDARYAINELCNSSITYDEQFIITGTVAQIDNTTYGNMYITDGEGNYLFIYGLYDTNGERYDTMEYQPQVGDVITIQGMITKYADSPDTYIIEIKSAILIDISTACSHEKTTVSRTKATCTEDAYQVISCADCGAVIEKKLLQGAFGHSFSEDGECANCGEKIAVAEKEILYEYASEELVIYLYSDYSSEYTEFIRTEDGSKTVVNGTNRWYEADGGIYASTDNNTYVFIATESGDLVLK